jgi:uncharacterized membrane protein
MVALDPAAILFDILLYFQYIIKVHSDLRAVGFVSRECRAVIPKHSIIPFVWQKQIVRKNL